MVDPNPEASLMFPAPVADRDVFRPLWSPDNGVRAPHLGITGCVPWTFSVAEYILWTF